MVPASAKLKNDLRSYRPTSLLSIVSKIFEKLLLRRFQPRLCVNINLGFAINTAHLSLKQCIRKQAVVFNTTFGREAEATFDRVWHSAFKLKQKASCPFVSSSSFVCTKSLPFCFGEQRNARYL